MQVKLAALPPREHAPISVNPAPTAIRAWGIGYLGAAPDEQAGWTRGFRRLLDSLDAPAQFVLSVGADRERTVTVVGPARLEATLRALGLRTDLVQGRGGTPDFGLEELRLFRDLRGCHRGYYLDRFAGEALEVGWLLHLAPPGAEVSIAWHVEPVPAPWALEHLRRRMANLRAEEMDRARKGSSDAKLSLTLPAASELQRKIAAAQTSAFRVATYVVLHAPTLVALEAASRELETRSRAHLVSLRPTTARHRDARIAARPLGVDPLRRQRLLDTDGLASYFPWLDADVRDPAGYCIGVSRATGLEVSVDPYDQSRYENANIAIFGHSGAGKTYLMSALLLSAREQDVQVFVIDPEHEYAPLTEHLPGAQNVELAIGAPVAINVMDLRYGDAAVADTVEMIGVIAGGLDEAEKAGVEEAVRRAYEHPRASVPVLGDVAENLPGGRTRRILDRWCQGGLGRMFSAPTNVDLDADLLVFGMRELREELVPAVHYLLAEALWLRIRERRRRTMLVVDELGLLFDDSTIRRFVVRLARRIRKYDGCLVFATQNPGDLLSSEGGTVVATNAAIRFLGAQRPNEAARLAKAFQLSDTQRQILEAGRRGEFLLAAGRDRLALDVVAPPHIRQRLASGA